MSRRQILDRLESSELEHDERVVLDTNNETVEHDRRKKDMEHRRIIRRAEHEQQELKQHNLESQLNRQQKFEPKRNVKQMGTETGTAAKKPMTARELRETLEQERRQRQNYRRAPPPNDITEKDLFRGHDPNSGAGAHPAHDEVFSLLNQRVHEGDVKPKKDPSHRQTTSTPAVVIENDDSLYAVSEPPSIKISKPPAAAAPAAPAIPSEQNKATAAHTIEISSFLRRLNNNRQTSSFFIEESTMRPCQASADALASVIHGLEGDLAMSKQKLSELVKVYNDHNAALQKRVRKSLALRIENLLAETERKSDYLYSLHDVVLLVVGGK